jgi:hypothetical protein
MTNKDLGLEIGFVLKFELCNEIISLYCSGYDDYYPPPVMGPPRGMPRGGGGMRPRMPPPPSKLKHLNLKVV